MKFIATYDDEYGIGDTLEEALESLESNCSLSADDRRDVSFFEATGIDVEFKIVRKEKPVKATTKLVGSK